MQADYKDHEHVLESLEKAVQEIDEMHELLILHKHRIPTVDTVILLYHSPAVALAFTCSCCVNLHATCCTLQYLGHSAAATGAQATEKVQHDSIDVVLAIFSAHPAISLTWTITSVQVLRDDIRDAHEAFSNALTSVAQLLPKQQTAE